MTTPKNPKLTTMTVAVSLVVGEDRYPVGQTELHLLHEDADGEQEWAGVVVRDDAKTGLLNVTFKEEPQPKPLRGRPPDSDWQIAAALAKAFLHVVANETRINEAAREATGYADARSVRSASRTYLDLADSLHIETDAGEYTGAYLLDEPAISKPADGFWCLSGHAKCWRPGMGRKISDGPFALLGTGDPPPIFIQERPPVIVCGKK
ncbi:MAG TPA: hypothetical protein PK752_01505 [Accumulibacter sp.]|uniref:hypothetical protein n=1 Tax=Accumulibacter sp. TaxID=2053492 RepID=UPI002D021730|nr:hypothetical protein [Accumulibacter sp.]HRD86923.1 hypothetical protein [Accumulibacter sp.]